MTSTTTSEIFRPSLQFSDVCSGEVLRSINPEYQNPRKKKRTKMIKYRNMNATSTTTTAAIVGGSSRKPKYVKKLDPTAPKITPPCSECGKTFWSWKALFGHMRCHPERPWRGINPPPPPPQPPPPPPPLLMAADFTTTAEDHYVASCLLMLSKEPAAVFECSSCKKVFGSHQALGGHRASHKNVKGCFAITRKGGEELYEGGELEGYFENNEHKCSICLRVFSSGQALGGHKRSHWEKEEEDDVVVVVPAASKSVLSHLDLNLAAPLVEDYSSCSNLGLDLRLGL